MLTWHGQGHDTKAKPETWTEQAKFREHADKLGLETVTLAGTAKTGGLDKLKAAFGETAKSGRLVTIVIATNETIKLVAARALLISAKGNFHQKDCTAKGAWQAPLPALIG